MATNYSAQDTSVEVALEEVECVRNNWTESSAFAIASSSNVSSISSSSSSNSSTCCCQLKIIQHQAKVWVEHLSQRDSARERDDIVGRIDGKAMVGRIDEAIKIGQKN